LVLSTSSTTGVLANDTDRDQGDTAALLVSAISAGSGVASTVGGTTATVVHGTYGDLSIKADGTYTYSAGSTSALALAFNATVDDLFTYTVKDPSGATATATLKFHVTGQNASDPNDYDSGENSSLSPEITLFGGPGDDLRDAGNHTSVIYGRQGIDTLNGGNQIDYIYGGSGSDSILGSTQDDHLYGGSGNDTISGETGEDIIVGGYGADRLTGGNGNDVFQYWSSGDAGDLIIDFTTGDKLEFVISNGNTHIIDGTAFSGGFSFANETTGGPANAITVTSSGVGGTNIAGSDVVIWSAGGADTMNTVDAIDAFLLSQNGTFDGGVLVVAYAQVGGNNVAGIYYDANASVTGGATLVTALSGISAATSLTSSDFHFIG
jgi:VCBS repeat-containing protein